MSENSNIAWTDHLTWNPWRGCDKVSEGCANRYITESLPFRFSGQEHGDPRVIASDATFNAPLAWNRKPWVCDECGIAMDKPNGHTRKDGRRGCDFDADEAVHHFHRRRVFSLSLGDWLDPQVPAEWLAEALNIIHRCECLDFLLCTQRPELWKARLIAAIKTLHCDPLDTKDRLEAWIDGERLFSNIWILVSAENQKRLDERVPHLLKIPAVVHGLSCEPLLEGLNLTPALDPCAADCRRQTVGKPPCNGHWHKGAKGIDWVVVAGEAGSKARPCDVGWIRSIKDQCQAAGVPVFVKRLGSNCVTHDPDEFPVDTRFRTETVAGVEQYPARILLKHPKGDYPSEWPADLRVRQFPTIRR